VRHTGFIGDLYRQFPFPAAPGDFKQNPEGSETRAVVEETLSRYSRIIEIPFRHDEGRGEVWIGDYGFTIRGFYALIHYVWVGGYPRWKEEVRPDAVLAMKAAVERSCKPLFEGMVFEG
jgi:hypothetical protein